MPEDKIVDLHVEVRVRNNQLLQRRKEFGVSQKVIASAIGVSTAAYSSLESCRLSPLNGAGKLRPSAQACAEYWDVHPDELFPEVVRDLVANTVVRKVDGPALRQLAAPPDQAVERKQLMECVEHALDALPERQRKVLTAAFGLETGQEQNWSEIGRSMGISDTRAHQLGRVALRKLRHPKVGLIKHDPHREHEPHRPLRDLDIAVLIGEGRTGALRSIPDGAHPDRLCCTHEQENPQRREALPCRECRQRVPALLEKLGVHPALADVVKRAGTIALPSSVAEARADALRQGYVLRTVLRTEYDYSAEHAWLSCGHHLAYATSWSRSASTGDSVRCLFCFIALTAQTSDQAMEKALDLYDRSET